MLLLRSAGDAATRFNPAAFHWREMLTRLAVVAVVGFGVILALGFFAAPMLPSVGMSKRNGG